jgi:serine/threonine protein kinase
MQPTLSPDNLSAAFRELQARAASGILHIERGETSQRVTFKNGRIIAAESNELKDQLGETLVQRQKLTASELHRARVAAESSGKNLRTVLCELDVLSAAALDVESSRLSNAILDAVFQWHGGKLRFEETPHGELSDGLLDLDPDQVASQALARAEEELNRELRWAVNAELGLPYAESTLSTQHSALVDFLKERFRSGLRMAEVVQMSTLSREETLEGLKALIAAGILDVKTDPELHPDTEPDLRASASEPLFPSGTPPEKLGRFQIQRVLGRGSMGAVLLAKDPAIDRIVAIKLIQTAVHLTASKQAKYRERFYREASAAGQLIHPNIVTVFDVGHADDGTPFIVMEYVDGKTLSELLETETISFAHAFQIAHDVLEGLAFAHAQGIVHRDVKPGNIIVTPDFRGKIMDFGIAHVVGSELTTDDDVLGSPYYMAPEQLSKGTIDRRSDLFSFAVVLYRMLTGSPPFTGDSFAAIAQSILTEDPIPPDQKNSAITASVRSVILRCLEKNPSDRYDNAEDVAAALDSAHKGKNRSAVTTRVRRSVVAHRDRWLPISLALVLGALFVFGLALTRDRQSGAAASGTSPDTATSPVDSAPSATPQDPDGPTTADTDAPLAPAGASNASANATAQRPQVVTPPISKSGSKSKPKPEPKPEPPPPATSISPEPAVEPPTEAELFYQARMTFERGELEQSRAQLEKLLLKDPTSTGAAELLMEVTDRIWGESLPLTFSARHNHRFGGCTGELSLTTLGVRYVSDAHDWAWNQEDIRVFERPDNETIYVETFEKDIMSLGKNKAYKFELDGGLSREDWARYERLTR